MGGRRTHLPGEMVPPGGHRNSNVKAITTACLQKVALIAGAGSAHVSQNLLLGLGPKKAMDQSSATYKSRGDQDSQGETAE